MDLSVAFGNRAVCERFARLWLQKFRSEDLSVCVETRSCRPHILDDESLKAAKKRTIDKPEETVITEPCITYRRHTSRVQHSLSEANRQQQVMACFSFLFRHHNVPIFDRVLTSDEKWALYDTPKNAKHWLSPQNPVPYTTRIPLQLSKIMLCIWLIRRQVMLFEFQQLGQTIIADLYSQRLERVQ